MPTPAADPARELARLLAGAVSQVETVSAVLAVGSVRRPDVPVDVARFVEGRWAALREVDRRARLDGVATALATVTREWSAGAVPEAPSGAPGDGAYRQGGIAALDELTTSLAG